MDVALLTNRTIICYCALAACVSVLAFGTLVPAAWSSTAIDREGSARVAATYDKNPVSPDLYPNQYESSEQLLVRESIKVKGPRSFRFEFNAYILAMNSSDRTSLSQTLLNSSSEINRASALDRHWYRTEKLDGYLTVDRLSVSRSVGRAEINAGRFPISLSTMSIFTPNDFFAPYRPLDFYRDYKPGVDAVRVDYGIGKKGQVSAIGVAGYEVPLIVSRAGEQNQGSSRFLVGNSAILARAAQTLRGFEVAAFAGKLATDNIVGASVQGGVRQVGIRGELHQKRSRVTAGLNQAQAVVGADYRLNPKIVIAGEQFYNGAGYANPSGYEGLFNNPTPPLVLGQLYSGIAGIYEATPLLQLRTLLVVNDSDRSFLISMRGVFSATERTDLSLVVLAPHGPPPQQLVLKSEFGAYPMVVSMQASVYF